MVNFIYKKALALSLLIKTIPAWPKYPTKTSHSVKPCGESLLLAPCCYTTDAEEKETLIGAFEKAPKPYLRGSPVNKETVLIPTTCTYH